MSNFEGLPPTLEEVANFDRLDLIRALKWYNWVRFFEDEGKRNKLGMT